MDMEGIFVVVKYLLSYDLSPKQSDRLWRVGGASGPKTGTRGGEMACLRSGRACLDRKVITLRR